MRYIPLILAALVVASACKHAEPAPPAPAVDPQKDVVRPNYDTLARADFNRLASRLNLAIYWTDDTNNNGAIDPGEVAKPLFLRGAEEAIYVQNGAFTPAFEKAYRKLEAEHSDVRPAAASADARREALIVEDLDQGRVTLVRSDLRNLPDSDREFARRMLVAGDRIDRLFATENGMDPLVGALPADPPSVRAFWRNWGARCAAPRTEKNPECSTIPGAPARRVAVYPETLQAQDGFCDKLDKSLTGPFTVVVEKDGKLDAIPFNEAWPNQMKDIADSLRFAAEALGPDERPLVEYLNAAADGFLTNDWLPADEAWSKMNARNSRWYVRAAPDETYWEPCSLKAGFHLSFARINPDSIAWQDRLAPFRQEMENSFAKLIGAPYKARSVTFQLPDFIDIIVNAGDSRSPFGATIGQSLPNWGKVKDEGRSRTVAMTNFYTDPDSIAQRHATAASLLSADTMKDVLDDDARPGVISTVLHEAAHNLGPQGGYKVKGKVDDEIFGGPMASTLEELKAQTASLWYVDFLLKKKVITPEEARQIYASNVIWAFGHISRGMYDSAGKPKPYSQLAAIQIGYLLKVGALRWEPEALAENGVDKGAFTIDFAKMPKACEDLMKLAGRIKGRGDVGGAKALVKEFVDGPIVPQAVIVERSLRAPKASFVYGVDL